MRRTKNYRSGDCRPVPPRRDPAQLLFVDMRSDGSFARPDAACDRVVTYGSRTTLPLPVRVADLLGDMLILLDVVRSDLRLPEAAPLAWAAPAVQRAYDDTSAALQRISS